MGDCSHEQDLVRVGSLVTPEFFVTRYPDLTLSQLVTPIPAYGAVPDWTLSAFRITDDSGVVAMLDIGPAAAPEGSNHVRFVEREGMWLIDEIAAAAG